MWKNLGFALIGLLLPSWSLMAEDNFQDGLGRSSPVPRVELLPPPADEPLPLGNPPSGPSWGTIPKPPEAPDATPAPPRIAGPGEKLPGLINPLSGGNGMLPKPLEAEELTVPRLDLSGRPAGYGPSIATDLPPRRPIIAGRLGWWATNTSGSPTKVAEYEGLGASPFVDVDGLLSDGKRTVDVSATNLDSDSRQVGMNYFAGQTSVRGGYQRYPHRLPHDPLGNMGDAASGQEIIREDLNVGEDYAIRVEEIRASYKYKLNEHITARLNFFNQRKSGVRQANAMTHCFGEVPTPPLPPPAVPAACHVLSQRQMIDWETVKLEPVLEAKFGPVRVEYSRPMRFFSQDDQIVLGQFWEVGPHFPVERPYAFVPDNVSQIDRVKVAADLGCDTDLYARLSAGDTEDKFRETHRNVQSYDVRLTNRSWDRLSLTGYITANKQTNQFPPFFLPEEVRELSVPNAWVPPYGIRHPIDYSTTMAGAEAGWRPFGNAGSARGLLLTAGWEQGSLHRTYADYYIEDLQTFVNEEHTPVTSWHLGASMRFSPRLDTYLRFKQRMLEDPLFGVNRYEGATNTNMPEDDQLVELGGTWRPVYNVTANATIGMQNRTHHSAIADFNETSFPVTCTLWYAPTAAWSLSAGCAFYSSRIGQDILFPSDTPLVETWDRSRWDYGGRYRVLNFGAAYAWTPKISLSGGLELVSGQDTLDPLAPWPDLPTYINVIANRTRVTAGVDWQLRERVAAYFRYRFEEYADRSADYLSGTVHMFLAGFSGVY